MECVPTSTRDSDVRTELQTHSADSPTKLFDTSSVPQTDTSKPDRAVSETAKRTKHTRVHKREKELCGLVTPIFLPLLEAGETSPAKRSKEKQRQEERDQLASNTISNSQQESGSRNVDKGKENRRSRSKNREEKMEGGEDAAVAGDVAKGNQKPDAGKKTKRSTIKKSSLRRDNTRSRRKRVSLVIDDQIVLPADNIAEPPLASPSETTASTTSNSTTSLDELIDPRLVPHHHAPSHHDAVHHSLPLPMALPSTSPTKHTGHTLSESPSAPLHYVDPPTAAHTFDEPFTINHADRNIPIYASSAPIYPTEPPEQIELIDEELDDSEGPEFVEEEAHFDTYVGGLSGSGVDDVNQSGSYGYPSSLGASYMESYMKSRPLSVRIAAAEKAELAKDEKRRLIQGDNGVEEDDVVMDVGVGRVEDVDEGMDVIGSMEDF